eukprot:scaffold15633_cov107-Isochrysis_galbana.AAC.9
MGPQGNRHGRVRQLRSARHRRAPPPTAARRPHRPFSASSRRCLRGRRAPHVPGGLQVEARAVACAAQPSGAAGAAHTRPIQPSASARRHQQPGHARAT